MKYKRFEDPPVWQDAVEPALLIYQLTETEPLRKRRGFCGQLERAGLFISNNIAEGFERGTTSELLTFLYIARGSDGEVRSRLCLSGRMETDLKSQISDLKGKSERRSRQLYGWMEQLKDSGIKGQRRLDENARKSFELEKARKELPAQMKKHNPKIQI